MRGIFAEHLAVIRAVEEYCLGDIEAFADLCREALNNGNSIFFMGNGGSAADSQHLAAEFVGRFKLERKGLPAIALTTDSSILTAVGNDYGFDAIFARQIEALARLGDVVVGISTSGNSPNVVKALEVAKLAGALTVGLTGAKGGAVANISDVCVRVPSEVTARIQEGHILVGHIVCELVDRAEVRNA